MHMCRSSIEWECNIVVSNQITVVRYQWINIRFVTIRSSFLLCSGCLRIDMNLLIFNLSLSTDSLTWIMHYPLASKISELFSAIRTL